MTTPQDLREAAQALFADDVSFTASVALVPIQKLEAIHRLLNLATPSPTRDAGEVPRMSHVAAYNKGWLDALHCHAHHGMAGWSIERESYRNAFIASTEGEKNV